MQRLDGVKLPAKTDAQTDIAQPHPKQKAAMEVFERLQKVRRMGMGVNIKQISAQLTGKKENAQFPENLFVEFFLPLFAGEIQPTVELNYTTWVEKVAGGERIPVEIIDADGKVLFTIPPIFDLSILEQSKPGTSESMTLIERHYSRLKEFDATGSQVFLQRKLTSIHIKEKPTAEVYENFRVWNEIFERYGRKDKIVNLLNMKNDPNKDKVSTIADRDDNSDVSDYELDTD